MIARNRLTKARPRRSDYPSGTPALSVPPSTETKGLTIVGTFYRDAETSIDPLQDGKILADFALVHGGFPVNGGLAAAKALPKGALHLVGVVPWWEYPELRRALPERIILDAIIADGDFFKKLPLSLVLTHREIDLRQILKQQHDLERSLRLARIPEGALQSSVIASGRIWEATAEELIQESRRRGIQFWWCGGAALPAELEVHCHGIIVDRAEAREMTGSRTSQPISLALALARRTRSPGAIRVVTGGGTFPAAVVQSTEDHWVCLEAVPVALAANAVRHLKGAGDVFAARFLTAFFDEQGRLWPEPDLKVAVQHARFVAAHYAASGLHLFPAEVQAAIRDQREYETGAKAIRTWTVRKPGTRLPVPKHHVSETILR